MTRGEAINCLNEMKIKFEIPKAAVQARLNNEALDIAIKALEQEPCEDLTLAYIKGKHDALEQEPKTGHWILADEQNKEDVENDNYRFICSECQCSDIHAKGTIVPYCWKCGARMESEEQE